MTPHMTAKMSCVDANAMSSPSFFDQATHTFERPLTLACLLRTAKL
jgi:hypothetical protein